MITVTMLFSLVGSDNNVIVIVTRTGDGFNTVIEDVRDRAFYCVFRFDINMNLPLSRFCHLLLLSLATFNFVVLSSPLYVFRVSVFISLFRRTLIDDGIK